MATNGDDADVQEWDDETSEIVRAVGKQIRLWRERAGLTRAELGARIGYGEHQVSSVERGRRIPKPEFLNQSDEVLDAGGMLAEFVDDVAKARYPKKVRDLARLEGDAVELGAYAATVVHGLLQTEDYARALFRMLRPTLDDDAIERNVAARMARQDILTRKPSPQLSFVLEEAALRRPFGGQAVWRGQMERLLEIAQLRHVDLQVMPIGVEENAGVPGAFLFLVPLHGDMVGHSEGALFSRVASDRREVRNLVMRYGIIRAQAFGPRESLAFIHKLLEGT